MNMLDMEISLALANWIFCHIFSFNLLYCLLNKNLDSFNLINYKCGQRKVYSKFSLVTWTPRTTNCVCVCVLVCVTLTEVTYTELSAHLTIRHLTKTATTPPVVSFARTQHPNHSSTITVSVVCQHKIAFDIGIYPNRWSFIFTYFPPTNHSNVLLFLLIKSFHRKPLHR